MTNTLATALPHEMRRVRDEILPRYLETKKLVGGTGCDFTIAMMRADLDAAAKAMVEGDVVVMLRLYEALKGYES